MFSRFDSRRLPGKVLRDIAGRPLLGRVLDRLRQVGDDHPIIVATSDRAVDDPIAQFAENEGVAVFRQAAEDVAGRALACAHWARADAFVRISGDSPFIDPGIIRDVIELYRAARPDLATNVYPRTFPPGLSVEVISVSALELAIDRMESIEEREHVTQFFYKHPSDFRIVNSASGVEYGDLSLTVDTPEDLERAHHITEMLDGSAGDAALDAVVRAALQITVERGDPASVQ